MPPSDPSAVSHRAASLSVETGYVLIAIPNATRAAAWRQIAMETGYPASVVRDGEEAELQITTRGVPVLLVTDLSLPKLDGFSVVRTLRQQPRGDHASVIVISAFQPLRAAAKELGQTLNFSRILPADVDQSVARSAVQATVGTLHDEFRRPVAAAERRRPSRSERRSAARGRTRRATRASRIWSTPPTPASGGCSRSPRRTTRSAIRLFRPIAATARISRPRRGRRPRRARTWRWPAARRTR